MLSKEECREALSKARIMLEEYMWKNNLTWKQQLEFRDAIITLEDLYIEHFGLIELLGLNKEYEKAGVEDKEQLKKLIEDNHKLWEHGAKLFNEERRKYLQNQIELFEKDINNIKQVKK